MYADDDVNDDNVDNDNDNEDENAADQIEEYNDNGTSLGIFFVETATSLPTEQQEPTSSNMATN